MTDAQKKFVNDYHDAALYISRKYSIPFPVVLAQAALESGWGKSAPGYNFFGVKAGRSWTGATQTLRTKEWDGTKYIYVDAIFRKYNSANESFEDFAKVLKKSFSYAFTNYDPVAFVRALQSVAGHQYATDPKYVDKVESVMNTIQQIVNQSEFVDKKKFDAIMKILIAGLIL